MLIVRQDTFSVAKFWYPNVKKELKENDKNRDGKSYNMLMLRDSQTVLSSFQLQTYIETTT